MRKVKPKMQCEILNFDTVTTLLANMYTYVTKKLRTYTKKIAILYKIYADLALSKIIL